MGDFLNFRKFITPLVIQILFWLGVVLAVIFGFVTMAQGGTFILIGLLQIVIGPVIWRIYCELLILLFRIYDELVAIRTGVPPQGQQPFGFPIAPNTPAAAQPPANP